MVRVVSVHHFERQTIQTCEDALAVAAAPPNRLLIAFPHHAIEVRDLGSVPKKTFSFPTVDLVAYLTYCSTGNYVATVEKKIARQDKEVVYSRVYTNWEVSRGEDQPMRARIAGRVTPSSSQTGGDVLEMIELPSRFSKITAITSCQETGNIMIACDRVLCLFQLVTRTHDISKHRFLDFELWPVTLELSFSPNCLRMSEDVVGAMNSSSLHVFRLNKGFARTSDWSSQGHVPKQTSRQSERSEGSANQVDDGPIDLEMLLKEIAEGGDKETRKTGNGPIPVLAMLPSLRSGRAHDPSRNLRISPFKPPGSVTMGVAIKEIPANEPWAEQMTTMVESLLQLELGEWCDDDVTPEKFTSLTLRPLYQINRHSSGKIESSCPRLRSPSYSNLVAFNCLICTQQEGFMYHFPVEDGEVMSLGKCISEYNFTSMVKYVVLEQSLLHVITTTGLETYTLRAINAIHMKNEADACPPVDEPVCLLGLRPFLSVVDLLLTKSFVVVLSSSNEANVKKNKLPRGDLTIYGLQLPSIESLYKEMLYVCSGHRLSCPSAYSQLLLEAHLLVRSTISVTSCHLQQPLLGQHLQLYRESCALLSDYYLTSEVEDDWEKGYKYSVMAGLSPTMVMDRLKKFESDAKEAGVTISTKEGLGHFLKECLIKCDEDSSLPTGALNRLLELAQSPQPDSTCLVSTLVLQSPLLRQFSTETSIRIITKHINESGDIVDAQDYLALCILYISRSKINDANQVLDLFDVNDDRLINLLLKYWTLLFDSTKQMNRKNSLGKGDWDGITLSELSVLLIEKRPHDLATILSSLIVHKHTVKLEEILQVFMTYLPIRMSSGSSSVTYVLQIFLEKVFSGWYGADHSWYPRTDSIATLDGLKILMRSYLSNLIVRTDLVKTTSVSKPEEMYNKEAENIFGGKRPKFLELLPPFNYSETDRSSYTSLLKLQCLLCSGWLDENVLSELVQFVSEFIPEDIGFNLLVLSQPQKGVEMIASKYPKVLPQYAMDMLTSEPEWKHLISIIQSKADEELEVDKENDAKIYPQILDEVLNNLARNLSCEVFTRIVPTGKEFEGYILTCQQTAHASHLKEVIKVTGHKLMATLNMKSFT